MRFAGRNGPGDDTEEPPAKRARVASLPQDELAQLPREMVWAITESLPVHDILALMRTSKLMLAHLEVVVWRLLVQRDVLAPLADAEAAGYGREASLAALVPPDYNVYAAGVAGVRATYMGAMALTASMMARVFVDFALQLMKQAHGPGFSNELYVTRHVGDQHAIFTLVPQNVFKVYPDGRPYPAVSRKISTDVQDTLVDDVRQLLGDNRALAQRAVALPRVERFFLGLMRSVYPVLTLNIVIADALEVLSYFRPHRSVSFGRVRVQMDLATGNQCLLLGRGEPGTAGRLVQIRPLQ